MDPEELRKLVKKVAIIAAFFVVAAVFYVLKWEIVLVVYAILVGIVSVLAILIQSGKGGGLATSLGGLGGDSLLGTHSATPIAKATYVMLGLLLFICLLVARLGAPGSEGAPSAPPARPAPQAPLPDVDL
jgi:preprotein translocase subunit SecG